MLIAYLWWCAVIWDDPLARFRGIDALTHEHAWRLQNQSTNAWIARLTWQPVILLGKMFFLGLAALIAGHWCVRGRERIWLVSAWVLVALYWFGSTSLSAYSPLPLSERMALPILPPLLVTVALTVDRIRGTALRVAVVGVLLAPGALQVSRILRRTQPETEAFAVLRHEVMHHKDTPYVLVCGEPGCSAIATFHFDFEVPTNLRVVLAEDATAFDVVDGQRVLAFVHRVRARHVRSADPTRDLTGAIEAARLAQMYCLKSVCLYDAGDGAALRDAIDATH